MRLLKKILLIGLTAGLVVILAFLVLLKYPTKDPKPSSGKFTAHPTLKDRTKSIRVSILETGYSDSPAIFVSRDGSLFALSRLPHNVALVEHPKATFMIDAGLGRDIDEEIRRAHWLVRTVPFVATTPLIESTKVQDLDKKIDFFLVTHVHWDHISGLMDFPEVPVYLLPQEADFGRNQEFSKNLNVFPHHIRAIERRFVPLLLKNIPYENFEQSLDLFGDGTVVIVPLNGHTPGSLGVFVNLAPDQRYLFVGDAVWSVDKHGLPEARSLMAELFSDQDRTQARIIRRQLEALVEHSNEIHLVPTHDSDTAELFNTTK